MARIHLMVEGEVFTWNPMRGIPRVYREILPRLGVVDPGIRVTVAVQGPAARTLPVGGPVTWIQVPGLPAGLRPWMLWSRIRPWINQCLAAAFWRRCRADVFLATHYGLPGAVGPSVCVVFDMIPELFPNLFVEEDAGAIRTVKRRAVRKADTVLCISENTRQDVIRLLGVRADRCRVMPLAGSVRESENGVEDRTRTPEPPFVLYVGGCRAPYKNVELVIEALASESRRKLDACRLVIAGPENPAEETLNRWRERLGVDRVESIAGCDDDALVQLYRSCSVMVMPSLYEGFGLPVLEALSCGAPVACSNAASLPEVGGSVVCYFDPHSAASCCKALEAALAEGRTSARVARRREWAARFSWEASAQCLASAVRDTVIGDRCSVIGYR